MGWKPFVAQELYSFVPADSIMELSRAVGLLFNEQGDRTSRKFARLKFVVDRPDDLTEIEQLLASIGGVAASSVLLMPEGVTREELAARGAWLAEICKQKGFRFCPRLHIELFGNIRGT